MKTRNPIDTAYGPEDYATDYAVRRLHELGQHKPAMDISEAYRGDLGDIEGMDPMEMLIALEEYDDSG